MHDRWEGAYYTSPKPSLDQVKNRSYQLQGYRDQTQDPCHVFHNKPFCCKAPLHWGVLWNTADLLQFQSKRIQT